MAKSQTGLPGQRPKKTQNVRFGDILPLYTTTTTIRGDTLFTNFAELISDEPNKIEGCATTRFEDLDLNCVIGWFKNFWDRLMTSL